VREVRLAIVGVRGIGLAHAEAALAVGVRIVACAARSRESAEWFADKYDVPFATTRATSIARRSDVDAVVIATPNKFHAPYAVAMLESGKDVLLEKPMAMNAREAAEVVKVARKRKRVLMIGQMWRFDDEVRWVREVVYTGAIGSVVRTHSYGVHVNWGPSGWFTEKRLAGGGALADMGVHALDTARFILGDPEPARVYATIGTHYADHDVDDTGVIMVTWKSGATSVIECGWRQPHADRSYAGTQVYGTKGYASVFPTEARLTVAGAPGVFTPEHPPRHGHPGPAVYNRQMQHFIDKPSPDGEQGLINQKILDTAYLSARTGRAEQA